MRGVRYLNKDADISVNGTKRLIVVAGDDYVEPLLENDVFDVFPWEHRFPFQEHDFEGIGEQMQWLNEKAEWYEARQNNPPNSRQTALRGYRELAVDVPDVEGQSQWSDWTDGTDSEDGHNSSN